MHHITADTPTDTIKAIVRTIDAGARVELTLSADDPAAVAIAVDIVKRTKGQAVTDTLATLLTDTADTIRFAIHNGTAGTSGGAIELTGKGIEPLR